MEFGGQYMKFLMTGGGDMKTQKSVTILLIVKIVFIATAFVGCTSDDQSRSSTAIKDIQIPTTVWDILQKSDESMSNLKLGQMDELLELFEQAPTSWEGQIMRAQAFDTSFQKKKALEVYIEVAKKYGNRAEPWIGIGKLCLDAAIADMTQRQLFTQKKGRYVFNPDKRSYDILLLARKYLSRANILHVTPQERLSQAAVYLFSPDRAESLLRQVDSMIARYRRLQEENAAQGEVGENALQEFEQRMAVQPGVSEKLKTIREAAKLGDVDAQKKLGFMYVQGRGIPKDLVLAYMWETLAVQNSNGEDRNEFIKSRDEVARKLSPAQLSRTQEMVSKWRPSSP